MSRITSVVVLWDHAAVWDYHEDEEAVSGPTARLDAFTGYRWRHGTPDGEAVQGVYAREFNHLQHDRWLAHVCALPWEAPERVLLFSWDEEHESWEVLGSLAEIRARPG